MRPFALLLLPAFLATSAAPRLRVSPSSPDRARMEARARNVTITRDDWGIAHVHGKSDADAVFGMIYAQAEDDFNRVETNYINALGRLAEAEGEKEIWRDLRMKLFIDPKDLQSKYATTPAWLKQLCEAWADGLNYYLETHPKVKPRVITKFEPWMPLAFSEGSIGGDIERVNLKELEAFYGGADRRADASSSQSPRAEIAEQSPFGPEPSGSNGIAIAPSNTTNKRALLLINPHTSFFFRSEQQVTSDEGLNAYGASTWGQFFIYQGFNARLGWMHTSSTVDAVDDFAETVTKSGNGWTYKYGNEQRPVTVKTIAVPYKTPSGMQMRTFTTYRTHHGPVVRDMGGKWIANALMYKPVEALSQSYLRTKARNLAEFQKALALAANSSNNTIYADADGNIAYFHPQFIPKRSDKFDYTKPVDGSDPATDWQGNIPIDQQPHLVNPKSGWIQNTNNWPYSAAGPYSPKQASFPRYMDMYGENPRGLHAMRVLGTRKDFSIENLRAAAFDSYQPAFAQMIPPLIRAWGGLGAANPLKVKTADQIALLRGWDYRWSAESVPQTLATYWGEELARRTKADAESEMMSVYEFMAKRTTPEQMLTALSAASDKLTADFGTWKTPWGEVNRFQRLSDAITPVFTDAGASIAVPFPSATWGSLASFGASTYPGTKKRYGTSGNSFVAVVEFGRDSVRAIAVTAGGESGEPGSKHFNDQAGRYAGGDLRKVYFYIGELKAHAERAYSTGSSQPNSR